MHDPMRLSTAFQPICALLFLFVLFEPAQTAFAVEKIGVNWVQLTAAIDSEDLNTTLALLKTEQGFDQEMCGAALSEAAAKSKMRVIVALLDAGVNPDASDPRCHNLFDEQTTRELLKQGTRQAFTKQCGWNALLHAAASGNQEIIDLLLKHGANVNHVDGYGRTALMIASEKRDSALVSSLIRAGADVNARSKSPVLTRYPKENIFMARLEVNPLIYSVLAEDNEILRTLLNAGASVNPPEAGRRSAVLEAAFTGNLEAVKMLIAAGANINLSDSEGSTPLMLAANQGFADIVETLLSAGADVNIFDKHAHTVFSYAADRRDSKIEEVLRKFEPTDIEPPAVIKQKPPEYPRSARLKGVEGQVVLQASVNEEGKVEDVVVLKGVDPDLDDAAVKAVKRWRYNPAKKGGKPIKFLFAVTTNFSIRR